MTTTTEGPTAQTANTSQDPQPSSTDNGNEIPFTNDLLNTKSPHLDIYGKEVRRIAIMQWTAISIAAIAILMLVSSAAYSVCKFNAHLESAYPLFKSVLAPESNASNAQNTPPKINKSNTRKPASASNSASHPELPASTASAPTEANRYTFVADSIKSFTHASIWIISLLTISASVIIFALLKATGNMTPGTNIFGATGDNNKSKIDNQVSIELPSLQYIKEISTMIKDIGGSDAFKAIKEIFKKE